MGLEQPTFNFAAVGDYAAHGIDRETSPAIAGASVGTSEGIRSWPKSHPLRKKQAVYCLPDRVDS